MNSALLSIFKGENNLKLGKLLTPSIAVSFAVIGLLSLISMA
ncbi:MAG: hypothetical protein ACK5MF_15790 [Vibrio sp.]